MFNNDTGIFNSNMGIGIMKLSSTLWDEASNYFNGTWNQGLTDKKQMQTENV